jgi:hypothetical protein
VQYKRTVVRIEPQWRESLDPSINQMDEHTGGKWIGVEDSNLKDVVEKHGGKDWAAIASLVQIERKNSVIRERN